MGIKSYINSPKQNTTMAPKGLQTICALRIQ